MAEQQVKGISPVVPVPEEWIVIGHEDIDGTQRVSPRSRKHWEDRGWYVVDETAPEQPVAVQAEAQQQAPKTTAPRGAATGTES